MKFKISYIALASVFAFSSIFAHAEVTLKFGLQQPVGSNEYNTADTVKKIVESKTNGEVKIAIYPSGQLGDDITMIKQTMAGALDFTYAEFSRLGLWIPRAEVVALPYVVPNFEGMQKIYNSSFGQGVLKEAADKFNVLFFADFYNGTRQTTSNRPINSIADFKGLKLRVPKAAPNINFAKYAGASPTPMSFSEVYLALQTNAVDGQENPLSIIQANKFYEVQKYLALTNHMLNDTLIAVSKASYNKLTPAQQQIIKDAIIQAGNAHTKLIQDSESSTIAFFKSQGMTVTTPNLDPFRAAMKPYYAEFNKKVGSPIVEQIEAIIKSK